MKNMQQNARVLAEKLQSMGRFELIGPDEEQLPLVAFRLAADNGYDEFDVAWQLSAERGWMVPAYTLPPDAQDVTIMRALVKETLSREHVDTLAADIEEPARLSRRRGRSPRVGAPEDRDRPRPLRVGWTTVMTEPICEVIITADSEDWLLASPGRWSRTGSSPADSTSRRSDPSIAGTARSTMTARCGWHCTPRQPRAAGHRPPAGTPLRRALASRLPGSGWESRPTPVGHRGDLSQAVIIGPDDSFDACQDVLSRQCFPHGESEEQAAGAVSAPTSRIRSTPIGDYGFLSDGEVSPSYRPTAPWNGCAFPALTLPASSDGSLAGTPAYSVSPPSMLPCPPMSATCQAP